MTDRASGQLPAKHEDLSARGVDASLLMERVVLTLGDRSGYYIVVGEERFGPLSADEAYQLWEDQMQGEVRYFDGSSMINPDGSQIRTV